MRLICVCNALLVLLCVVQPSSARRKRQTDSAPLNSANDLAGSVLRELSGFLNGLTGNNIDNTPVLSARDDSIARQPSAVVQPNAMPSFSSCLSDMANNFFGSILGGGQTPTSSATSFPQQSNSILQSNAKFADSPTLSSSSDPLDRSDVTERILNGFSARQRGQLQNLPQPAELRAPDAPVPSDIDRQRRNMEVLMKLRERHLANELAKGLSTRQASNPIQLIEPQTQIPQTLANPTSGTQQILGTGPRQDNFLDTGGLNFDRFVMNEKNEFDALGNPVLGNWKKSGLQWTDGDLKLVDVKGNNVLGNDVAVRDKSIDIPIRSWWNFANRFVPLPNDRPEYPAALWAG